MIKKLLEFAAVAFVLIVFGIVVVVACGTMNWYLAWFGCPNWLCLTCSIVFGILMVCAFLYWAAYGDNRNG